LLCTPRGQVMLLPEERSAIDINAAIEEQLALKRREFWQRTSGDVALAAVREVAGVRELAKIPPAEMVETGRVDRDGYHIDKFVLKTDRGVPLPGLTYHPAKPGRNAYLYLHDAGKTGDGAPGGPIEKLVKEGHVVVAVDLRGLGETASGRADALLGDSKTYFLAYLLGQSLVGMQTEDVLSAGHFVANYKTKQPRQVHLIAVGRCGIPALHAAALEPGMFATVRLRGALEAWSPVVKQPVPAGQLTSTVHGALKVYDLPDLARAIGPDKLKTESGE